jgi:hypothetical protein
MNRLARERSPYLLQHANNPVDWFPWGDDAFTKARTEHKPIFLSIGYSTCHWCHVMERESFESDAVAVVLNEHFVSVKVDREERPDVDRVYMAFVQATTGSGGWPMSVWLTPDLKPFYGGTYFPPDSRWGRPGFVDILREIARVWAVDGARVGQSADELTERLAGREVAETGTAVPGEQALERTTAQFRRAYDPRRGGFGDAPKFPRPSELLFLLREHARTGATDARDMVLGTLRAMALGGMRDHIGGGFHRYSVDGEWRVPHFEKMLYDQAQLTLAFLEASQLTGKAFFLDVALDTLRYVMREMTDPQGGFYSAEDADSIPPESVGQPGVHPSEGAFYLWRADEIDRLCGDDAALVRSVYGVEADGNAPADPHQEFVGKNILYLRQPIEEVSAAHPDGDVRARLERARLALFTARLERPRPLLDDKVLTSWNGLMIAAFARAARVIRAHEGSGPHAPAPCLEAARAAARFLKAHLWRPGERVLLRRYRQGHAAIEGYAEDYACLVFGLLELFQADPDPAWLEWAETLQRRQDELFWDAQAGGWFSTTGRDPSVLLRLKETYDGAEPAATSVSALNLQTFSGLIDDGGWRDRLEEVFRALAPQLESMGRAVPLLAAALSAYQAGPAQIVVVSANGGALERQLMARYLPHATILVLTEAEQAALRAKLPLVAAMTPVDDGPTVYLCRHFVCQPPLTSTEELARALPVPIREG